MNVPLCIPELSEEEKKVALEVLESGWLAHGPYNKKLEQQFKDYLGVDYAISMNSCTSALQLAVQLSGITGEVILPSFTFVASANSIVTGGAIPVFADIKAETRNIDPAKIREKITKKTQAIMPVHYGGYSADMDAILDIAKEYNLKIIEDSAEAIGAMYKDRMAGSMGIGCFSFFPTKNITTGEGGMLTTNDKELATKAKAYIGHGILSTTFEREKQNKPWLRAATYSGYNFRMSNLLAALGVKQMDKIDAMNKKRQAAAKIYDDLLVERSELAIPKIATNQTHTYQMYTVLLDKSIDRTRFLAFLNKKGIGASVHFDPPVHTQPAYNKGNFDISDLAVTEDVASRIVTLPMFPSITQEQLQYVVDHVKEGITKYKI